MNNVRIPFDYYNDDPSDIIGYQYITDHLVSDVNMGDNFRINVRHCA